MAIADPFNLERFVLAQNPVFAQVRAELAVVRKQSHWMWFIFPQHLALGRSGTAQLFGIVSLDEAAAFLVHPVLGSRLKVCCEQLLSASGRTAHDILGSPDDLKLCSSMTLFATAIPEEPIFQQILDRFYSGKPDMRTLELVGARH